MQKSISCTLVYVLGLVIKTAFLSVCSSCWASSPEECPAPSLINTRQSLSSFPVRCFTPQTWIPNCLRQSRDSQSAGWRPRRTDRVSFPHGWRTNSLRKCTGPADLFFWYWRPLSPLAPPGPYQWTWTETVQKMALWQTADLSQLCSQKWTR